MIASIDIGTSYSSICILSPEGKPQPVEISADISIYGSKYSLPSAIYVEDNGNILVGQAAMNSRERNPKNFIMEFKRNFGEAIPIMLGTQAYLPEELYTLLYRHMKDCAEKKGGSIEKVYLTCPAAFGRTKREKVLAAARGAGFFDAELIDEPTAAAMSYCAEKDLKDGQKVMIYDFGGGTFDVSLLQYVDGEFRLLSEPMGLEHCGGVDIDRAIFSNILSHLDEDLLRKVQESPLNWLRLQSHLAETAVKAKHQLSTAEMFKGWISIGFDMVDYQLDRGTLNYLSAGLVGNTIDCCKEILKNADMKIGELSAIFMVGGTSRVPLVQDMVGKFAEGVPVFQAADMELAVAEGALAYALREKRAEEAKKELKKEVKKNGIESEARMVGKAAETEESAAGTAYLRDKDAHTDAMHIMSIYTDGYEDQKNTEYIKKYLNAGLLENISVYAEKKDWSVGWIYLALAFKDFARGASASGIKYYNQALESGGFSNLPKLSDKAASRWNEYGKAEIVSHVWSFLKTNDNVFYEGKNGFLQKEEQLKNAFSQQGITVAGKPLYIYDASFWGTMSEGFAVYPEGLAAKSDVGEYRFICYANMQPDKAGFNASYLTLGTGLYLKVKKIKELLHKEKHFVYAVLVSKMGVWDYK